MVTIFLLSNLLETFGIDSVALIAVAIDLYFLD